MGVKFTNNAATTLSSGISSGATSFTVAAATDFPTLGVGDWTYVSLTNEVVKVTAISGGTFTCVATSGAHSAGVSVELRMTSELLNDFAEDLEALPITGGALTGAVTTNSTFDGVDIATRDGVLTTTTTTANAALPKAGGAMTGAITTNSTFDGVDIAVRDAILTSTTTTAGAALPKAGGAMTGAITTNSTFDGRDVATDGTKLDNIETSATADQTNAEIKTAVQAATSISLGGSPTTTTQAESDDSTKIATTAYVTDKITTLIGGAPSTLNDLNELANAINDDANYNSTLTTALGTKLPKAGGTMTGNLSLGDSIKAQFGASNDLQIQHTGGNSFITDGGTGQLYIQGSSQIKLTDDTGSENFAVFNDNGAVQLYYDNVEKVTTTGTGVSVTGNVVVSGTVDGVDIASRDSTLTSTTTTAGAALPKAGGTVTGVVTFENDIKLTDNDKILLGTGDDLKIYHDGADSYIHDSGTGVLEIRTNGTHIGLMGNDGSENMGKFVQDGAVELYHNGVKKFETTATGVSVTGNVAVSGTVDGRDVATDGTKLDGIATGATNVTNNNQITNGSGYITSYTNTTYSAGSGLDLSGTTFSIETDLRDGIQYIGRDNNDYISIGTTTIDFQLDGADRARIVNNGDFHADGDVIAYSTTISDERLKENIQPIEDALSKVNQLTGYTFTYTADGKESAGLIAQDVEKVLPSAVSEKELPLKVDDGEKYKVLQYDQTIGLLVEAIKELSAKVEELEGK